MTTNIENSHSKSCPPKRSTLKIHEMHHWFGLAQIEVDRFNAISAQLSPGPRRSYSSHYKANLTAQEVESLQAFDISLSRFVSDVTSMDGDHLYENVSRSPLLAFLELPYRIRWLMCIGPIHKRNSYNSLQSTLRKYYSMYRTKTGSPYRPWLPHSSYVFYVLIDPQELAPVTETKLHQLLQCVDDDVPEKYFSSLGSSSPPTSDSFHSLDDGSAIMQQDIHIVAEEACVSYGSALQSIKDAKGDVSYAIILAKARFGEYFDPGKRKSDSFPDSDDGALCLRASCIE